MISEQSSAGAHSSSSYAKGNAPSGGSSHAHAPDRPTALSDCHNSPRSALIPTNPARARHTRHSQTDPRSLHPNLQNPIAHRRRACRSRTHPNASKSQDAPTVQAPIGPAHPYTLCGPGKRSVRPSSLINHGRPNRQFPSKSRRTSQRRDILTVA